MAKTTAYIGLGSNLGDRKANLDNAVRMLKETQGIDSIRLSDFIETAPLGQADQPMYLNTVAELKTSLSAENLLNKLMDIETELGRQRNGRWSPRTIDLDLLLFGNKIIESLELTIPHPQMHLRSFVLKGLCQLNHELVHPLMKEWITELCARLNGGDFFLDPEKPQLISIAGVIGVGKTTLTNRLAESFGCMTLLEPYDTNPFMPEVYAGKKELALDSQLYFLTSRLKQLAPENLEKGQIYISDYVFEKEIIYARQLLNQQQLEIYEMLYPPMSDRVTRPVLVLYMQDSEKRCLDRIHDRNRPYEQRIKLNFLKKLRTDYDQLLDNWKKCPIIRITLPEFNCERNEDIEYLTNKIKHYIATV